MRRFARAASHHWRRKLFASSLILFFAVSSAAAQTSTQISVPNEDRPEYGGHEVELWSGGGHSVPGGTKDTGVWNLGFRYGWIVTAPHLPGPLKGRFELAVDAVPAFVVFQRRNTAYGWGLNPVGFKWILATRGHVAPFMFLDGGTLLTTHNVPYGTSTVNFTTSGGIGTYFLGERAWSVDVRFLHISNAGLTVPNPGVNTVQVRLGFGKFFKKK